jgi:hypothetical protein
MELKYHFHEVYSVLSAFKPYLIPDTEYDPDEPWKNQGDTDFEESEAELQAEQSSPIFHPNGLMVNSHYNQDDFLDALNATTSSRVKKRLIRAWKNNKLHFIAPREIDGGFIAEKPLINHAEQNEPSGQFEQQKILEDLLTQPVGNSGKIIFQETVLPHPYTKLTGYVNVTDELFISSRIDIGVCDSYLDKKWYEFRKKSPFVTGSQAITPMFEGEALIGSHDSYLGISTDEHKIPKLTLKYDSTAGVISLYRGCGGTNALQVEQIKGIHTIILQQIGIAESFVKATIEDEPNTNLIVPMYLDMMWFWKYE